MTDLSYDDPITSDPDMFLADRVGEEETAETPSYEYPRKSATPQLILESRFNHFERSIFRNT